MGIISFGNTLCFKDPEKSSSNISRDYQIYRGFNYALNALKAIRERQAATYFSLSFKQKVVARENLWKIIQTMKKTVHDIQKELIGRSIQYKGKSFVIRDIDFGKNPTSTFKRKDKEISYLDHAEERYGKTEDPIDVKQPMVKVIYKFKNQKKEINYLIPQ